MEETMWKKTGNEEYLAKQKICENQKKKKIRGHNPMKTDGLCLRHHRTTFPSALTIFANLRLRLYPNTFTHTPTHSA